MPGLWGRERCVQEATNQCFSPSFSLPFPVSKNKEIKYLKKKLINEGVQKLSSISLGLLLEGESGFRT